MGRKLQGLCPFWGGAAGSPSNKMSFGSRPTFISSGILIHRAIWPQQIWAKNWGVCPFEGGGPGSPSNRMWPGPRPTCTPSFILICPIVWPQYTNVTFYLPSMCLSTNCQMLGFCWQKNLFLPDMKFKPRKKQNTSMVVHSLPWQQDFLCILQDKHCNTAVHSQSHQLLCKICINANEKCIHEAKIRFQKLTVTTQICSLFTTQCMPMLTWMNTLDEYLTNSVPLESLQ